MDMWFMGLLMLGLLYVIGYQYSKIRVLDEKANYWKLQYSKERLLKEIKYEGGEADNRH